MRLLLIALLLSANCHAQAISKAAIDPELEVILAFLQSRPVPKGQQVIEDTLSVGDMAGQFNGKSYREYRNSLLAEASDDAPADLIVDFCKKNRRTQPVWPELRSHAGVILLSRHEADSFFGSGNHMNQDGWKLFYAKYPQSGGITGVSRVGFNRKQNIAMFWVHWSGGWLLGWDQMHVMHKQGKKWVESLVSIGPIIMS